MTLRTSPLVLAVALGLLNPAALEVEEPPALDRARTLGDDGAVTDEDLATVVLDADASSEV